MMITLLPGACCSSAMWQSVREPLNNSFSVNVIDYLKGESLAKMVENAAASLSDKSVLVGFSLGGWVAQMLAHQYPEKISGLVLICTTNGSLPASVLTSLTAMTALIKEKGLEAYIDVACEAYFDDLSHRGLYKAMVREVGEAQCLHHLSILRDQGDAPFTFLNSLSLPILILQGSRDKRAEPGAAERFAKEFPFGEVKKIENAGHFTPLEAPDLTARAVNDFIQQLITET